MAAFMSVSSGSVTTENQKFSMFLHDLGELLEVHRLDDVAVGVQAVGFQDVGLALRGGQHHDRDAFQLLVVLDFRQNLAAVLSGQVEVEQDEAGARRILVFALPCAGTPSPPRRPDVCRLLTSLRVFERLLRQENIGGAVLDEQDFDRVEVPWDSWVRSFVGDGEGEGRTLAGFGFHGDAAAVALDDLLADGQADARAGILGPGVQPLEDDEDALEVFGLHADAVVLHREYPMALVTAHADVDSRRLLAAEFDGVADEVLEQLRQLGGVRFHDRKLIVRDDRTRFRDGGFEVRQRLIQDGIAVAWFKALPRVPTLE